MCSEKITKELSKIEMIIKLNESKRKILTIYETSVFYDIKESKIKSWVAKNIVPYFIIDDKIVFHKEVLDAWLLGKFSWNNLDNLELEIKKLSGDISLVSKKVGEIEIPKPPEIQEAPNYTRLFIIVILFQLIIMLLTFIK